MSLLAVAELIAVAEREAIYDPEQLEALRRERGALVRRLEREARRRVSPPPVARRGKLEDAG